MQSVASESSQPKRHYARTLSPLALGIAVALGAAAPVPALAEADSTGAVPAQTTEQRQYRIEGGPLDAVLNRFALAAGIDLSVSAELTRGKTSPGLNGRYSVNEGLRLLLAGSGLSYRFTGANGVTLVAAQGGDGPVQLGPIRVSGEAGTNAVEGYVARRVATATKTDTPIIETPQSISVISQERIEALAAQNIGEAVQYSAGVISNTQGDSSPGGSNITIRGFNQTGTGGASFNEYVDGLRIGGTNFAVAGFEPYLFERVEILKGPSSVLYGQGLPSGIVNHVSKRPTAEPLREVQFQAGSFERYKGALDLGGPMDADEQFLYRLTAVGLDSEQRTDFTENQRVAIAPALTWQPDDDTQLTFLISYQDDNYEPVAFVNGLPAQGTALDNPNGKIDEEFFAGDPDFNRWDRETFSLGYQFEHRFNEHWAVRQNLRYRDTDLDLDAVFGQSFQPDLRTLNRAVFTADERAEDFTVDNQAETSFATGLATHTVVAGVDYQRLRDDTLRGFAAGPPIDVFNPDYSDPITQPPTFQDSENSLDQVGIYLQDQIRHDGWILTLGGRYDWAELETENNLSGTSTDQSDEAFTGRVGLGYVFENGLAPYVGYSESFEPVIGQDFEGNTFDPTTGEQYEIGIKYQPPGYNALVTLAVFELTQTDVTTGDPNNPGFNIQTGEIRTRGVELEVASSLSNGLDLTAAYTYLDNEITQSNDGDQGNTLPTIPDHTASVWGDYTIQSGSLAGLGTALGVRYVDSSFGDRANSFKVDGYTLVDAALHYDLGRSVGSLDGWKVSVNARNLFDKDYITCNFAFRCYFRDGRTFLATVGYTW